MRDGEGRLETVLGAKARLGSRPRACMRVACLVNVNVNACLSLFTDTCGELKMMSSSQTFLKCRSSVSTSTWIKSRMPSSLSLPSMTMQK